MTFLGKAHLSNDELNLIYHFLTLKITRTELSENMGRSRTNTYYYIGRAVQYWIRIGVLKFKKIKSIEELGGYDIEKEQ